MSFILDALRKSESERQRQATPGLVDAGFRPPVRRRALWIPLLSLVLVANLLVMGVMWLRRAPAVPPPAAAALEAPQTGGLAAAAGVQAPAESEYDDMANEPAVEGESVTGVLVPTEELSVSAGVSPGSEGDAGMNAEPAPTHLQDDLPSAEQLIASGALSVPPMHLDIHVFSTVPAERFVFINMRKYTEGAQLPGGARIEEITADGVVLSMDGQRFVLTRE